jgi:voltage-gated potassium channel Kch
MNDAGLRIRLATPIAVGMSATGRIARQRTKRTLAAGDATNLRAPRGGRAVPDRPIPTRRQRLRYRFDATMSRGPIALVGWLALVTLALIGAGAVAVLAFGLVPDGGRQGFGGQLFSTLMHAMDPGTVAGDDGGWPFLAAMLVVTLGGLFIVSALIGVIATALDAKLLDLRKGRSFVVERDHTLVLGWSDAVFTILSELAIANESEAKPSVVILADRDKVEMEDAIRAKVGDLKGTKVICRTGSPIDLTDIAIANPQSARSVIVLSPESDDPDSEVIKTVLALTRGPHRRADGYRIVAEIHDPANLEAAHLVGRGQASFIDKRETIAKLIVQASRQSGVSAAYVELLDFDGEEIYFRDDAALVSLSYGDALLAYEHAAVMGLQRSGGEILLNPAADVLVQDGDRIIAIAQDDAVLELHLREIAARLDGPVSIVSEMLDDRNHELAQVTEVDDVIVSDKVLSLLLAQISENQHLAEVFRILFDAAGSEIYLRDVEEYVRPGRETTFATVVAAARERGESALGLRLAELSGDPASGYGVRLTPAKSATYVPAAGDKVVVLAED